MNKIYTLTAIFLIILTALSCSSDDCVLTHDGDIQDTPNIISGTFPTGKLTPKLGEEIVFAPQLHNSDGVTYRWSINGKTLIADEETNEPFSGKEYTFSVDKPCHATIGLQLSKNNATVTVESEIYCEPDLDNGFLVVQGKRIDYYNTETGTLYEDVYASMNRGTGLGNPSNIYVSPLNEKLYITLSSNTSNIPHLIVANSKTLKSENSYIIDSSLRGIMSLNKEYGITYGYKSLWRIKLATGEKVALRENFSWGVYNSVVLGDKLLMNTTYQKPKKEGEKYFIQYYNTADVLKAGEKELGEPANTNIEQNSRMNFISNADGSVYTMGFDSETDNYYLVKIKQDLSQERTPLPFIPRMCGYSGGLYTAALTFAKDGNAIYIPADDHSVYKYIPGDAGSLQTPFIKIPADNYKLYGNAINVDPATGNLYICYWNDKEGKIVTFDPTGKETKTINCGNTTPQAIIF